MVIYGNNFAEKLQSVAISREHLKYNTPFCDIVDAPEWQTDINLALDFNKALTGNTEAATTFVQDLTLNSNQLDPSTIEFYLHKIKHNPVFADSIKEMRGRWDNLEGIGDEFQDKLKDALKDCLNSPCNLFQETSDSIGRMAQTASTRSSDNSMGSLELFEGNTTGEGDDVDSRGSISISNMIDGLDQTITNKIPGIFKDAFTEVVGVANKAFENTQDVLVGKKNLADLASKAKEGKSFRDPAKVFRYSPDVKSYFDYSAASSNVLAKIKEDIGGCFNRFEFKYRYNPYENNMSRPIGTKVGTVNGRKYDSNSAGVADRSGRSNSYNLDKQTTTSKPGVNVRSNTAALGKGITKGDVKVSKSYLLAEKGNGNRQNYSVFASLIDEETKTLWYEGYDATPNDVLTLQGVGNIGQSYRIGNSIYGPNLDFIKRALNGDEVSTNEIEKYGKTTQPGNYAAGFKHQLDDAGMETLFNTPETKILNDGVAISKALFREFLNDPNISSKELWASYKDPQLSNEFFVAVRPVGSSSDYKYYKVIDSNSQSKLNLDFTMGAWSHFLKSFGYGELKAASRGAARRQPIEGTQWTRVNKVFTDPNVDELEVRICIGPLDGIKEAIGGDETAITAEETEEALNKLEGTFTPGNSNVSYDLANKTRNQPLIPKLAKMIDEISARTGYRLVIFSAGQDVKGQGDNRTGSQRHDGGYAADIRIYDGGTQLSSENSSHLARLEAFARVCKDVGIMSFGCGPGYMGGDTHIDISLGRPGVPNAPTWGVGSRSATTPSWLRRVGFKPL